MKEFIVDESLFQIPEKPQMLKVIDYFEKSTAFDKEKGKKTKSILTVKEVSLLYMNNVYVYVCVYMYMCICVCVCMYVRTHTHTYERVIVL